MKHHLSETDKTYLKKRVAETEKSIQSQVVLATVEKSDSYSEIPWKAFATGASFTALPVAAVLIWLPVWLTPWIILISLAAIFLAGSATSLLSVLLPPAGRLFLSGSRAHTETRQYAASFFLERELFNTPDRRSILIMVSLFEKQVVILPDKGMNDRLSGSDLHEIISVMKVPLSRNRIPQAFGLALNELEARLKDTSATTRSENNFSDDIIEEPGA